MQIAFLNPQGNFDPKDSYWTEHPDFGGQLVYVKQVALAMAELGHTVDILTRQIIDPEWPEFAEQFDAYPESSDVRIIRIPAGPKEFLRKEDLWPYLVTEWVPNTLAFYRQEGTWPDAMTAHYGDGGLCGALIEAEAGIPFTFTAHSLGAQKMDKLGVCRENLAQMDGHYRFMRRLMAERLAMNRSIINLTSTYQERYSQYSHNAYRGAVDWTDDQRFSVVPPGVNLTIFDRSSRYSEEEATHEHIQAMLKRGNANLVMITGNLDNPLEDYQNTGDTEKRVLDGLMTVIDQAGLRGQVSMFALRGQGQLAAGYRFFAKRQSVFTLTALYEPFGLAPLEAIAAGLPAVVTKFGGPSESLREGDKLYGLLVDPGDPEETSEAFSALVQNPESWQQYAEAGYQRVLERYTWQRTAQGYLTAIQNALENPIDRASESILPIPAYFQEPKAENDFSLADLDEIYLEFDLLVIGETLVNFISNERVRTLRAAQSFTRHLGGQPASVAVYVAKLGKRSAVLSRIGEDPFGAFAEERLQYQGVNTEALINTAGVPTTTMFVTRTTGTPDFLVYRGADAHLIPGDIQEELIARAKIVHTSLFALSQEPSRSGIRRAIQLAYTNEKIVSLEPNYHSRFWPDKSEAWEVLAQVLPYVTIVKPSLEDARQLYDPKMEGAELEEACLRDFHNLGARLVIFTRSGGPVTISDGKTVERITLDPIEVESVVGGSEAFWAGLLVAYLDEKPWPLSIRFAHLVAAQKMRQVGHIEKLIDRQALYQQLEI
jgi:sucrose-phosphate synthase